MIGFKQIEFFYHTGTVFNNRNDWRSDLRWFIPNHNDEYTTVVENFAPAFRDEFLSRLRNPEGTWLRQATLYATGHSLGGRLAQEFAYSLPVHLDLPRVSQVFAVTGFLQRRGNDT